MHNIRGPLFFSTALLFICCSDCSSSNNGKAMPDAGRDSKVEKIDLTAEAGKDMTVDSSQDVISGDVGNIGVLCIIDAGAPSDFKFCGDVANAAVLPSFHCQSNMCLVLYPGYCPAYPAFCTRACQKSADCPAKSSTCPSGYECQPACPTGWFCGSGANGSVCVCKGFPKEL